MKNTQTPLILLALSSLLFVTSCGVGLGVGVRSPRLGIYASTSFIDIAPPQARREYYGHPPYRGYFWVDGYWAWNYGRYEWQPGHWEAPRDGYRWVPHRWERDGRGWRHDGGRWDRRY